MYYYGMAWISHHEQVSVFNLLARLKQKYRFENSIHRHTQQAGIHLHMHKIQFCNALKLRLWKLKQGLKIQYHYYTLIHTTIKQYIDSVTLHSSEPLKFTWNIERQDMVNTTTYPLMEFFCKGGLSEKIEWGIKKESLFYNIFSPVFFSSHHPIINQPNRTTL